MNLKSFKLLRETARLGSFASVARQQATDPSNVSRAIAQLEQELGVRLFQRSTRKLSLTEAGGRLLQRIEPLLLEFDQAIDEAQELKLSPKGIVRITASVSFGQVCILPYLSELNAMYPDLKLELQLTDSVVDIVASGIDLAFRLAPPGNVDLVGTRLFSTRYRVCASPEYLEQCPPIQTPSDLSNHTCLVFTLPQYQSDWKFRNHQHQLQQVEIHSNLSISSALALRECATQGLGPALLPNWLVDKDIENKKLFRVLPEYECTATSFDTWVWLLYPSRHYLPHKTRVVIDFFKQKLSNSE